MIVTCKYCAQRNRIPIEVDETAFAFRQMCRDQTNLRIAALEGEVFHVFEPDLLRELVRHARQELNEQQEPRLRCGRCKRPLDGRTS